ncbi:hypothetical protein GCM10009558_082420 [Virgisporangium aurantiacum]
MGDDSAQQPHAIPAVEGVFQPAVPGFQEFHGFVEAVPEVAVANDADGYPGGRDVVLQLLVPRVARRSERGGLLVAGPPLTVVRDVAGVLVQRAESRRERGHGLVLLGLEACLAGVRHGVRLRLARREVGHASTHHGADESGDGRKPVHGASLQQRNRRTRGYAR